jgi:NodT family efflux transporter outer membrane factor (OMF) lipoprotein
MKINTIRSAQVCKRIGVVALGLLIALSSGCADTTPRNALAMRTPPAELLANAAADANGSWPQANWVASFHDSQLDTLVAEACSANPDIQIASARIAQAQSQLDQFGASEGLTGTAMLSAYKARMPEINGAASVDVQGTTVPINLFSDPWVSPGSAIVGANYELDLWGKNEALTRSLLSSRDAARVNAQQAQLTIVTSLVTLYGRLSGDYERRDLIDTKRRVATELDAIRRERQTRGMDNTYDIQASRIEQATLQAQAQQIDDAIRQTQLQIGILVGAGPERGLALQRPTLASANEEAALPPNLPLDLLGRRPDIVAARLRVEAATAKIAVTRASFYPNINLSAAGGLSSLSISSLFSSASAFFALGPAVTLPIFERGRLHAQLDGDYAQADEMIALYNRTLNEALTDVARSILATRSTAALINEQQEVVNARKHLASVAADQHRRGLIRQTEVLQQQNALLDERLRLIDLTTRRRDAKVALIRSLGGGFEAMPAQQIKSSSTESANRTSRERSPSIPPSSS